MSFSVITGVLASDVAAAGTFTAGYPSGKDAGNFYAAHGHKLVVGQNNAFSYPNQIDITLGTSSITVTNKTTSTWLAGSTYRLQVEEQGERQYRSDSAGLLVASTTKASDVLISLGAPDVADADGISVSQSVVVATTPLATITGALASGGVATFDVPRNVVGAWTGTAVLTVTGTDVYGKSLSEASASGTSLAGKKAFKTITAVSFSANVTAATVGSGDVLGLPVFLPEIPFIRAEIQDGAAATAGTLVAGVQTAGGATTTTGDIRGTYDPNAACDGSKVFQLIAFLPDAGFLGALQNLQTS